MKEIVQEKDLRFLEESIQTLPGQVWTGSG
jgi:hypothetical protein